VAFTKEHLENMAGPRPEAAPWVEAALPRASEHAGARPAVTADFRKNLDQPIDINAIFQIYATNN
jgi:hypothetical protein